MSEPSPSKGRLEVRGHPTRLSPRSIWVVWFVAAWVLFLLLVLLMASLGDAFPAAFPRAYRNTIECGIPLGAALGVAVPAFVFHARRHQASGIVQIDGTRLSFKRGSEIWVVPWASVHGFRDGAAEFVELVAADAPMSYRSLTIPTIDEKTRTEVLGLLDERGLQRLER